MCVCLAGPHPRYSTAQPETGRAPCSGNIAGGLQYDSRIAHIQTDDIQKVLSTILTILDFLGIINSSACIPPPYNKLMRLHSASVLGYKTCAVGPKRQEPVPSTGQARTFTICRSQRQTFFKTSHSWRLAPDNNKKITNCITIPF